MRLNERPAFAPPRFTRAEAIAEAKAARGKKARARAHERELRGEAAREARDEAAREQAAADEAAQHAVRGAASRERHRWQLLPSGEESRSFRLWIERQ